MRFSSVPVNARQQIAERLRAHIATHFRGDIAAAAKSLGISRQRLHSYTAAVPQNFPGAEMIDSVLEKWGLDLIAGTPRLKPRAKKRVDAAAYKQAQLSLFDIPITLAGQEGKLTLQRKGFDLVAKIELLADVKIA